METWYFDFCSWYCCLCHCYFVGYLHGFINYSNSYEYIKRNKRSTLIEHYISIYKSSIIQWTLAVDDNFNVFLWHSTLIDFNISSFKINEHASACGLDYNWLISWDIEAKKFTWFFMRKMNDILHGDFKRVWEGVNVWSTTPPSPSPSLCTKMHAQKYNKLLYIYIHMNMYISLADVDRCMNVANKIMRLLLLFNFFSLPFSHIFIWREHTHVEWWSFAINALLSYTFHQWCE